MQSHESDQAPENEIPTGNFVPISEPFILIQVTWICLLPWEKGWEPALNSQHPIEKYMSYGKLSQDYKAFVAFLDSTHVPRNIQEAFQHPEWTAAVNEELQTLAKNNTWEINTLP